MRNRQTGLTLIELLVAIAVLAIIAVLGWRGLDSIVRARIALASELEQTRGMQLAFAQLHNDCSHLAEKALLPDLVPIQVSQGKLAMVRRIFAENQPPRLQVIVYRVNDGRLTRSSSVATRDLKELNALWKTAANESDVGDTTPGMKGTGVVLQSGVADMKMRLWIRNGWHDRTATSPPGADQPTGLEVVMQLQGREGSLLKIFLLGAG